MVWVYVHYKYVHICPYIMRTSRLSHLVPHVQPRRLVRGLVLARRPEETLVLGGSAAEDARHPGRRRLEEVVYDSNPCCFFSLSCQVKATYLHPGPNKGD